jgi:proteasome accessory factor C
MSPQELREDVAVLNVVNFGGGAYVIYAEVLPTGEIEVDPEPYSDTFDRPARLLPIEAKALVAAIDLIGLAHAELLSAREKVVEALGFDPVEEGLHIASPKVDPDIMHTAELAIHESRLLELVYWTQSENRYSHRVVEPYGRINSREGWYIVAWDRENARLQHFRLDRIKEASATMERFEPREGLDPAADIGGWPRTGRIGGSRAARVLIKAGQARWVREQRPVLAELPTGEIIVEITFKGLEFLVREVLKEAGDAVVIEPADAREAVLAAAEGLIVRAT